jgi:membrane protease YdiL (CAAX protease family)
MTHRAIPLIATVAKHAGLGLCVVVAVPIPWAVLGGANLRLSPHVPWAIPAGVAYLFLALLYLNGRGWPRSTSAARRRDSRLLPLAFPQFGWSLLAGLAAIASLWLLYAASGQLSASPAQRPQPDLSPVVLFGAIVIGAGATALAEEVGLRGFMQAPLESVIGPGRAIAATAICFVLIHLSHGFEAVLRYGVLYLAAGCIYGLLAYLTQSVLPSLLLHFLGDVLLFGLRSSLLHVTTAPQPRIRACLFVSAVVAAAASGAAFIRLARVTRGARAHLRSPEAHA